MPSTHNNPLHIAMVVRVFSGTGGLELYAHKIIEGLLEKGHKLTVICQEKHTDLVHPALKIICLPTPPSHALKYQRLQFLYQQASQALIEHGPFDLVHSQHCPVNGAEIVTFHNHTVEQFSRSGSTIEALINNLKSTLVPAYRLRKHYDQLLCQQAFCLIFTSHIGREDYLQTFHNLPQLSIKPYMVAYPGISTGTTMPGNDIPLSQDPVFTFLFVGKGYRKKGLDVLLKSCALLTKQNKNFKLLIAGLKEKWIDRAKLQWLGLEGRVQYLGFVSEMSTVYRQASAFVMPSRLDIFGMAALESMYKELVPIVSSRAGISEVLEHGKTALILQDPLNAKELSSLMAQLINNPELVKQLSCKAQELSRQFVWEKTIESTLKAYQLVLQIKRNTKVTKQL